MTGFDLRRRYQSVFVLVVLTSLISVTAGRAADTQTADPQAKAARLKHFETKIRPLLAARCFKCHSEKKQKGGLRLDAGSLVLKGGESGAAIVPGKPDESLLIESIRYESFEMPPDGKLPEAEIALLTQWVADGAFWPETDAEPIAAESGGRTITDEDRQWWSYQPVVRPEVPEDSGTGWARNAIDRFIARKLDENKLRPAPEADRQTLIRRVYFDLIGLPPSPGEIAAFMNDPAADAYEKLIDRLLDSPRYGERWARHWLDLVRYSESDGYRQDAFRPTLWRYRDYVVRSFNSDKAFDQFVSEQIAGDEIDPHNPDAVTATAYWRLYLYEYNQRDVRGHWRAIIDELTDISGEVFLGTGIGCAKCHDHKFDPILRDDYFRFQAFFSSIEPRDDVPLGTLDEKAEHDRKLAEWEAKTQDIRDAIAKIRAPYESSKWRSAVEKFPPDVRSIADRPQSEWDAHERQLMNLVQRQIDFEYDRIKFKEGDQKQLDELTERLKAFDGLKPAALPTTQTVRDSAPAPAITYVPGDRSKRDIAPGFLSVIDPEPAEIPPVETAPDSTGRRTALAHWIASPDNPLSTRVITNRIWQYHFGSGIVETASDFGHLGEAPSHPELLDWLTSEFVGNGWRFKSLHRLILMSATYRQTAFHPDAESALLIDPRNRLRWRADIRRLDAEQIRDAALAVSGELDPKAGGPSADANGTRRSVYTKLLRNSPNPVLKAFDAADGFNSTAQRNVTTTPTQALLMINGKWSSDRARAFAKRVDRIVAADLSPGADVRKQIVNTAWLLTYGREPELSESEAAVAYLNALSTQKPEAPLLTDILDATDSPAVSIQEADARTQWKFSDAKALPEKDFTIEAVIVLKSLYPDANVRTIASQWDGNTGIRGWNFGVTSTKSAYQPRNLILQLIGGEPSVAGTGKPTYEVIASNLRPELNEPHYVAVSVDVDDESEAGVTFYLKNLAKPDAKLETASAKHKVTGDFRPDLSFVLGDRDGSRRSRWDGLIDDVRLSATVLKAEELLINGGSGRDVIGLWQFADVENPGRDSSGQNRDLSLTGAPGVSKTGIEEDVLADFCHVLLNSNEFLYVD